MPVLLVRRWRMRELAARVRMPEAPVQKDDLAPPWEDEVRPTGKGVVVKAVPVAESVHEPAHDELRY